MGHPQQGNALPKVIDQLLLRTDVISQSSPMFVFIEVILPHQHFPIILFYTHTHTQKLTLSINRSNKSCS